MYQQQMHLRTLSMPDKHLLYQYRRVVLPHLRSLPEKRAVKWILQASTIERLANHKSQAQKIHSLQNRIQIPLKHIDGRRTKVSRFARVLFGDAA